MKKRLILAMVIALALSSLMACGKKDEEQKQEVTDSVNNTTGTAETKSREDNKEETSDPTALYEAFMSGEEPVYCDRYIDYFLSHYDEEPEASGFENNKPYLISDFVDALISHYQLGQYGEYHLDEIQYAYIDCGMDGVKELALKLPDIVDCGSERVSILVIKEFDGKLQLCFEKNAGYRSFVDINSNGYVDCNGSGGAAVHDYRYSFLDANADEKLIYNEEEIYGVYSLYFPGCDDAIEIAEDLGIADSIIIIGYDFDGAIIDDYDEIIRNRKYTYYKVSSNYNIIEDDTIYSPGSDYYDFMSRTGLNFVSPDELDKLIAEHEKSIGYSDAIKTGDFPEWVTFYHAGITAGEEFDEGTDDCVYTTVSNPGWEYYSTVDYDPTDLPIVLTQKSKKANDIIDDEEWLDELGQSAYDPFLCSDEYYNYYLSGDNSYDPYVIDIYNKESGVHMARLDMSEFVTPPQIAGGDEDFVSEAVRCVQYSDGLFYVAMNHSTYASSAPQNGYIMALDPANDYRVVWKSQPLVSNAYNFQIIDNTIICGYGFTAEKDYIYLLDKHSGVQTDVYPVKTGPDYFFIIDGTLYVRTYDTNYEFQISFG